MDDDTEPQSTPAAPYVDAGGRTWYSPDGLDWSQQPGRALTDAQMADAEAAEAHEAAVREHRDAVQSARSICGEKTRELMRHPDYWSRPDLQREVVRLADEVNRLELSPPGERARDGQGRYVAESGQQASLTEEQMQSGYLASTIVKASADPNTLEATYDELPDVAKVVCDRVLTLRSPAHRDAYRAVLMEWLQRVDYPAWERLGKWTADIQAEDPGAWRTLCALFGRDPDEKRDQ